MSDVFGLGGAVSFGGKALFLQEYSISVAKKAMTSEVLDAKRMLAMAPNQGQIAAAASKGKYIDVYA